MQVKRSDGIIVVVCGSVICAQVTLQQHAVLRSNSRVGGGVVRFQQILDATLTSAQCLPVQGRGEYSKGQMPPL